MNFPHKKLPNTPILQNCTVLGVAGLPFVPEEAVHIEFFTESLMINAGERTSAEIPYLELAQIDISGPGTVTKGGGFIGGGFGIDGAIQGIALASILNTLTTRSKVHTFLTLITNVGEIHLHYGAMEPSALRISLSEVFVAHRRFSASWIQDRLQTLECNLNFKNISPEAFETFKERLLKCQNDEKATERFGLCPACNTKISLTAEECPKCRAMFGEGSAWRIKPI